MDEQGYPETQHSDKGLPMPAPRQELRGPPSPSGLERALEAHRRSHARGLAQTPCTAPSPPRTEPKGRCGRARGAMVGGGEVAYPRATASSCCRGIPQAVDPHRPLHRRCAVFLPTVSGGGERGSRGGGGWRRARVRPSRRPERRRCEGFRGHVRLDSVSALDF